VARASPDNSDLRFCGGESGTGNAIEDWSMSSLKRGECVVAPSEGLPTHCQDAVMMATKPRHQPRTGLAIAWSTPGPQTLAPRCLARAGGSVNGRGPHQ
jgi:hypothetical protein